MAHADGRVRVHRAVRYDKIGPGAHECYWCTAPISWDGSVGKRLVSDHLDGNTWNNDPGNLVQACRRCNHIRGYNPQFLTHCYLGHEFTEDNTYWRPDGRGRQCRICNRRRDRKRRV